MLVAAADFIRAHQDFIIISHVSPDGDTIGSGLALYAGLLQMGKTVQLVCADPVPKAYRYLKNWERYVTSELVRPAEAVISVDCATAERTGSAATLFDTTPHTLNIDHHETNNRYLQVNYVELRAAAAELIYDLLDALNVTIDAEIATCLYTALVSDTGNFAFQNTTSETLLVASKLVACGAKPSYVNRMVYATVPLCQIKINIPAYEKLKLYHDGQLAITSLTREDFDRYGATSENTQGLVSNILDIETAEISAYLREGRDGGVRVSLRAKNWANVSKIAEQFGGGGHTRAAGCTLHMPLEKAVETIRVAAEQVLTEQ